MSEVSVVTQVHERVWTAYGRSSWASNLTLPTPSRALVLGGGGATGIGWLGGLIIGLREQGIDLGTADTVIGTSAGSVVGTHVALQTPLDLAFARLHGREPLKLGRLGPAGRLRPGAQSRPRRHRAGGPQGQDGDRGGVHRRRGRRPQGHALAEQAPHHHDGGRRDRRTHPLHQ
jgi:NTE family protein